MKFIHSVVGYAACSGDVLEQYQYDDLDRNFHKVARYENADLYERFVAESGSGYRVYMVLVKYNKPGKQPRYLTHTEYPDGELREVSYIFDAYD
jgi:hypothetical protein